jgi:hypothetical protein
MPPTTSIGRTAEQQKGVLGHLITIGEATAGEAWPDDLTSIKGIGPQTASKLAKEGITSFRQLANIDAETVRSVVGRPLFGRQNMDQRVQQWSEDATERVRAGAPDADLYLRTVRECRGMWARNGFVERTVWIDKKARTFEMNIFRTPPGHDQSLKLAKALRSLAEVSGGSDGYMRVPNLDPQHVDQLRAVHDAMVDEEPLDERTVSGLNEALADTAIELSIPGPYQSITEVKERYASDRGLDVVYGPVPESWTDTGNYGSTEYASPDSAFRAQGTTYQTMTMDVEALGSGAVIARERTEGATDASRGVPPPGPGGNASGDERASEASAEATGEEDPK